MSGPPPFARPRGPAPKSHPRWNELLGRYENAAGVSLGPKRLAINGVSSNEHRPAGKHAVLLPELKMLLGNERDALHS